jgi:putative membrane protein
MKKIMLFLKGMAMGAADVVPGVSGGTIAFITGIYDSLLGAIANVNLEAIKILKNEGLKPFWNRINGSFLLVLFSGIATSIFSLAKVFQYFVQHFPVQLWSFFFGLILASIPMLFKEVKKWDLVNLLSLVLGTGISFYITIASPSQGSESLLYIFLCGAIAICAMILPGISGSFILLLLGAYHQVLGAVSAFDLKIIFVFMLGAVVGLISFSNLIKYLLSKHFGVAMAVLTGFLIGSLNKIWPWKQNIQTRLNSKGEVVAFLDKNVLPTDYSISSLADIELGMLQKDPVFFPAILCMILGFALVYLLGKVKVQEK